MKMKRHNAKAIAAAVAIATAAAAPSEAKKKAESNANLMTPTLYVDVVKNMPKPECPPSVTPPFTILREDFPALPGTHEGLRRITALVPDDWATVTSSDDDDNDPDELQLPSPDSVSADEAGYVLETDPEPQIVADLLVEIQSSDGSSIGCKDFSVSSELASPDLEYIDLTPDSEVYQSNFYDCPNSGIFEKQFITAGMYERAGKEFPTTEETESNIQAPPGFEHIKFYGRLRTNRMGVPLGGVTFDITPPRAYCSRRKPTVSMEGAYGLAGLAKNLEAMQYNPRHLSQMFGHEAASLNVGAHGINCEANKLHACFAGPLLGGRCASHEVDHDVPQYYRRSVTKELPQPKVDQMEVELLFFFFFKYPGDMMQMLAAAELAERGWRYHIYERLWLRRQADNPNYDVDGDDESGEYNYFNMIHWKIMARHFKLQPEQLERTITKIELREHYGYHPQMSFF